MPVTRSASRQSNSIPGSAGPYLTQRQNAKTPSEPKTKGSRRTKKQQEKPTKDGPTGSGSTTLPLVIAPGSGPVEPPELLPAVLTFSLDEAKQHLIQADPRFEDLFHRLQCRPWEQLERVDPFRTLTTSILGQQISWLAARAIVHKFIRLFDPSMPEKPPPSGANDSGSFFPLAHQVCTLDIPTLRTAGLSGRKAEYVQDLAARFADGRLSNEKIFEANDEELYEMLTAVRGIGNWTVDMFAIFSLRRPNILPVGDLGVQRGIVRWILSLHSPKHKYVISPRKLPKATDDNEDEKSKITVQSQEDPQTASMDIDLVDKGGVSQQERADTPDASSIPPAPIPTTPKTPVRGRTKTGSDKERGDPDMPAPPPPFTPSINRTLNKVLPAQYHPPPLPEGLSIKELQTRLDGKKKIKGAILTPQEMEALTESWKPYRSLGVYYMWALSEAEKA